MWAGRITGFGAFAVALSGLTACGTYEELAPGAQVVRAESSRPPGNCKSLGIVVGKGGGDAGGTWVSNQRLLWYALNDARNQAAALGATDVVYSAPTMGDHKGTTNSAMITAEALQCEGGTQVASAKAAPVNGAAPAAGAPSGTATAPAPSGCQYDTQCKGNRVCDDGECVEPSAASSASAGAAKHGGGVFLKN